VTGATGSKDAGNALKDVGDGLQDGSSSVAKASKDAGEWKA